MITSAEARRMVGGGDTLAVRGDDFYATPPEAVRALLAVETFTGPIWEPACGDGSISKVLIAAGHEVVSTDLVERGYGEGRIDFLMERRALAPNVVTNPPFKLGTEFARKALALARGKVAFLMRLVWLEGQARRKFFDTNPPARIWVFSARLPRMHRFGYKGRKSTASMIAFAWFVWEAGYRDMPRLGWIEPDEKTPRLPLPEPKMKQEAML